MATPASSDVNASIHQLIDAFKSGNTKAFADGFLNSGVTVTDEYPPYLSTGTAAVKQWPDTFEKDAKSKNIIDPALPYNEPTRADIDGKTAYVIMPSTYSYKQTPTAEEGTMTSVLNMTPKGWKVRSWTWTSASPHPVK